MEEFLGVSGDIKADYAFKKGMTLKLLAKS
jgi:hypothetical protein